MNNKKISIIIFGSFLIVTTLLAIRLVSQNQDSRRSAAFASGRMYLVPESGITAKVGEDVTAQLWVDSGNAKVDAIRSFVCYDGSFLNVASAKDAVFNGNNAFDNTIANVVDYDGKKCLDVTVLALNSSNDHTKNAAFNVFNIRMKALKEGSGRLEVIKDKVEVTGANPNSLDKTISMNTVTGASYQISAAIEDTTSLVLNFKVSFIGMTNTNKCSDMRVQVVVRGQDGTSKSYQNVPVSIDGQNTVGDRAVYKGALRLNGFTQTQNLSVFIKGAKHLQTKYGKNNQSAFYGQPGGEIGGLTNDNNSPVFDFSAYPSLPGDVAKGENEEGQDGFIDGRDYTFVKSKAFKHEAVNEGGYMMADLDGNCIVNAIDADHLRTSLKSKQDEIY